MPTEGERRRSERDERSTVHDLNGSSKARTQISGNVSIRFPHQTQFHTHCANEHNSIGKTLFNVCLEYNSFHLVN